MLTHWLDPERRESLLRLLIDGKAGAMERELWDLAEFEQEPKKPRAWQFTNSKGEDITPPLLKAYNEARAPRRSEVQEWARALIEHPAYQEALQRRIDDGKAPTMHARLLRIKETQARAEPEEPPFIWHNAYGDWLPWDAEHDRMPREKTQRMIEAKEREEKEARAQQAAPDKQAAAAPEEPVDPDHLELVRDPEPDDPEPDDRGR